MGLRKKQTLLFLLAILSLLAYTSFSAMRQNDETLSNEDFIRFHVIANSDTAEDQQLKLKVRDGVLMRINADLAREAMAEYHDTSAGGIYGSTDVAQLTINQSRNYIKENLSQIEKIAEKIIRENGYDYTVKAELGVRWIPQKTYGDVTFPAGNYEALNITIGSGNGHNWWCVLFPPLCLIDEDVNSDDALKDAVDKEHIDAKYKQLLETDGEPVTLKLKFKTLEITEGFNKNTL